MLKPYFFDPLTLCRGIGVQKEVFSGVEAFYISLLPLLQSLENGREQSEMAYAVLAVLLQLTDHCTLLYQHHGLVRTCGSRGQLSGRSLTCFATWICSKLESCPQGLWYLNITYAYLTANRNLSLFYLLESLCIVIVFYAHTHKNI